MSGGWELLADSAMGRMGRWEFVEVEPRYVAQICSSCGFESDVVLNAAENVLRRRFR